MVGGELMLTTQQAADLLRVERVTILKWIERGHIKATKFGRDWMIDQTPAELKAIKAQRKPGNHTGKPRTAKPRE